MEAKAQSGLIVGIIIAIILIIVIVYFAFSSTSDPDQSPDDDARFFCGDEERNATVCTQQYDPVCGWDANNISIQTYGNSCEACRDANVEFWTEGECLE